MDEKKFFSLLRQFNELEKNKNTEITDLIAGRIPLSTLKRLACFSTL